MQIKIICVIIYIVYSSIFRKEWGNPLFYLYRGDNMAKKKHGGNTVQTAWKLAEPIASYLGLEIWDIRFVKEGADWYLRIFIDKPEGVTIEDCEAMSRAIDKPLDDENFIEQSYCLEVSSPGIERELVRPEHFEKFIGAKVMVRMIRPLENGTKDLKGVLMGYDTNVAKICSETGETLDINKKDTVYIKLDDFES